MKFIQSVLSQKYQTVIPSAIRRTLGLQAGDTILWRIDQHGRSAKAIAEPAPRDWAAYTRGLGKDLWASVDIKHYINELRDEWQRQPS